MNEQLAQHDGVNFNNPICKARIKSFKKMFKKKKRTLASLHNSDKQKTTYNTRIWFAKTLKRNDLTTPLNYSPG